MKIGPLENKANLATPASDRKAPASGAQAASPEPSAKVELSAAASVLASVSSDGSFDARRSSACNVRSATAPSASTPTRSPTS